MSVTMLDTSSWTPAQRQAAARDAYRASGYRLSGTELGARFGRWGRAQIQAVATEDLAAAGGSGGRESGSPVAATDGTVRLGEGRLAVLLPISVDGLVVAGSTTMVVRRRHGHGGGWLAWLAVSLGIGASLAANVVAAEPSLVDPGVVRRAIAGWPPVALAISAELAIEVRSGGSHRPLRRR